MALRKNNQKDYEKFANPNMDVLGDKKKVAGEYTGTVRKDKKGMEYAIAGEGDANFENYSGNTVAKGDTIIPSQSSLFRNLPNFQKISMDASTQDDEYIMGGDYNLTETKSSKKRPSGPRTYKID